MQSGRGRQRSHILCRRASPKSSRRLHEFVGTARKLVIPIFGEGAGNIKHRRCTKLFAYTLGRTEDNVTLGKRHVISAVGKEPSRYTCFVARNQCTWPKFPASTLESFANSSMGRPPGLLRSRPDIFALAVTQRRAGLVYCVAQE